MTKISQATPHSGQTNRIIFFGTEDFSAASLHALIKAGYPIAAVITKPDSKKGRGQTLVPPAVKLIAEQYNIPVWQPLKLRDITDQIRALQPVAGILVSFGKIIPQSTIDLFTPGIINVHPSRLPLYRGPSPLESAILNGDKETGVSIMQLSAAMDAGPVYSFTPHIMRGNEQQDTFYATMAELGAEALLEALPSILDGSLKPRPQDESKATYCQLIKKDDGLIDWSKTATQIEREIRAYRGWPRSRTTIQGLDVIITNATVLSIPPASKKTPGTFEVITTQNGNTAIIHTSEGAIEIQSIKPVDKKEMPIQAFLSGYKQRLY